MKVARGWENDLQNLAEVHKVEPFDLQTLIARFKETDATMERSKFQRNFLSFIERILGGEDRRRGRGEPERGPVAPLSRGILHARGKGIRRGRNGPRPAAAASRSRGYRTAAPPLRSSTRARATSR